MTVDTARQAAELLAPHLLARAGGAVAVLHVDSERRLIDVAVFDPDAARLPVRDILARALRAGADSVIVAIGRPPGDSLPTEEETAAARRLAEAAASLDLRLTDFFIFAGADCRSFRELGLL
ncbi:MAG TPA: JAB domain-containing protein [Allosphingosinicella sp.]|nr:JAB domain-containing protein [Allosphingosinicella sp.]